MQKSGRNALPLIILFLKYVFDLIKEAGALGIVCRAAKLIKLLKHLFLIRRKVFRHFYRDPDILISSSAGVQVLDALILKLENISGLRSGMYPIAYLTVKCRNNNLMSQSRLREGKGYLTPYVIALAFKDIMLLYTHIYMKIPGRAAVIAAVAVSADIENLILIDSGRNRDRYRFWRTYSSCAGAFRTGLFYDLALSAALFT